jgi:hypothetical protein
MNKQELQEYIKLKVKEATLYKNPSAALSDPSVKDTEMRRELEKMRKTQPNKPVSVAEINLEEESRTYGDAITKTYMYLDAIYDRLEDMDPESSQAQELKAKFDDFNDNILKPIFRDIIGR